MMIGVNSYDNVIRVYERYCKTRFFFFFLSMQFDFTLCETDFHKYYPMKVIHDCGWLILLEVFFFFFKFPFFLLVID